MVVRRCERIEIRRRTSSNGVGGAVELRWWSLVSHLLASTASFQITAMTPSGRCGKTVVVCDVVVVCVV